MDSRLVNNKLLSIANTFEEKVSMANCLCFLIEISILGVGNE